MSCKKKAITKGSSFRKIVAPVSSGQFPRQSRRADLISAVSKGTSDSYLQRVMNTMTRTRRVLPPAKWRKATAGFVGLCGCDGLTHQMHRSIRL